MWRQHSRSLSKEGKLWSLPLLTRAPTPAPGHIHNCLTASPPKHSFLTAPHWRSGLQHLGLGAHNSVQSTDFENKGGEHIMKTQSKAKLAEQFSQEESTHSDERHSERQRGRDHRAPT